jgi:hypothetical protein
MSHETETLMNWAAGVTVVGTLLGWLPHIAATLGIVWYCILIYDRFFGDKNGRPS